VPNITAAGVGRFFLVLVGAAMVALIVWYSRGWWQEALAKRLAALRLGPWPVRPEEVATRADLVRAFEYLALLLLGPSARTCNHLELARRISQRPTLQADRNREAAEELARLYEQARYTPPDERLPDELMSRARRELSYLAGGHPA
jgi:hypothetical protein